MDEQIAQKRHAIHSSGAGRVDVHPFPENPPDGLHGSVVKLLHGKEITPVPIRWLWDGWLAAGKTHILGGAPGVGKSTLALSLAAVLSIGGRWPDGQRARPGSVAIWSGEDDPRDTLAPRLLASGADMGRIFFVDSVFDGLERRSFDPARDMAPLRRKLLEVGGIRLLIVDPVVSAIAGDSHKNAEVRRGLQPLADLAESLDCALLGITHFSKGTRGNDPVERLNGSIALGAVARVVLVAAKHQAPDEEGRVSRVLCRAKSNIGPDGGGFAYDLHQDELAAYPGVFASSVLWGETLEGSARELLGVAGEQADSLIGEVWGKQVPEAVFSPEGVAVALGLSGIRVTGGQALCLAKTMFDWYSAGMQADLKTPATCPESLKLRSPAPEFTRLLERLDRLTDEAFAFGTQFRKEQRCPDSA